jgi:hypothetical protein
MIPGIVAGQANSGAPSPATRPVLRGTRSFGANAASQTVLLPTGWQAGDLHVLVVAASDASSISISGWSSWGFTSGTGLRLHVLTRVAQAGDEGAFSVPSGGRRACILAGFQAGTYNTSVPFVSAASNFSGSGTSVTAGAGDTEIPAGLHFLIQLGASGTASGIETITYPYSQINTRRGANSTVSIYTWCMASGGEFNGGFSPSSSFTIGTSMDWASRVVVIRGKD